MKRSPRASAALGALDRKRGVFAPLVAEVVGALARKLIGGSEGAVVELGSGLGALRAMVPEELERRLVETEPLARAAAQLHAARPGGKTIRAAAEALPLAGESVAAVVGLDVLDELAAPALARDEIARVLRPGGLLVHALDLSPNLDALLAELDDRHELPLPNFLGDAIATGLVRPEDAPPLRLEDDLLVVPRHQLWKVASVMRAAQHALARPLLAYLEPFSPDVFAPAAARAHFVAIASDPRAAQALSSALLSVYATTRLPAYRAELPLELRALATHEAFARRLRALYTPEAGFEVELDALVSVRRAGPGREAGPGGRPPAAGPGGRHPAAGFEGRWAGRTVRLPRAPEGVRGVPLAALCGGAPAPTLDSSAGSGAGPGPTIEAGVHIFAARRLTTT